MPTFCQICLHRQCSGGPARTRGARGHAGNMRAAAMSGMGITASATATARTRRPRRSLQSARRPGGQRFRWPPTGSRDRDERDRAQTHTCLVHRAPGSPPAPRIRTSRPFSTPPTPAAKCRPPTHPQPMERARIQHHDTSSVTQIDGLFFDAGGRGESVINSHTTDIESVRTGAQTRRVRETCGARQSKNFCKFIELKRIGYKTSVRGVERHDYFTDSLRKLLLLCR